jgi:hypothetical protein
MAIRNMAASRRKFHVTIAPPATDVERGFNERFSNGKHTR